MIEACLNAPITCSNSLFAVMHQIRTLLQFTVRELARFRFRSYHSLISGERLLRFPALRYIIADSTFDMGVAAPFPISKLITTRP